MRTGSVEGFLEFCDWVRKKGLVKEATAQARKAAVAEVLGAQGDDRPSDIRELDVEAALRRFENLRAGKYAPASMAAYKTRFRKSVADYLAWLDNPDGWRPDIKPRAARPTTPRLRTVSDSDRPTVVRDVEPTPRHTPSSGGRLIDYPFPVREGVFAFLSLPSDLTREEASRIAAHVETLAMPERVP